MIDDPLASPAECRCDGTGWIFVLEGYVRAHVDRAPSEGGLRNSVYPCKFHNPHRFHRWAEGHYAQHHDEAECDECRSGQSFVRRTRRMKRAVPVETRKDVIG